MTELEMLQPTKRGEFMKKLFELFFTQKETPSRLEIERQKFSKDVRKQFLQLKEKGLSIPVFTL